MINEKELVNELVALLPRKESKEYYAKKLNVTRQEVEHLLAIVRNKNTTDTITKKVNLDKGTIESTLVLTYEPKDDVELAKLHKIDLTKYVITNYWSKVLPNGKFTSSVFSKLKKPEDYSVEDFQKFLETYTPSFGLVKSHDHIDSRIDVEISIADFHLAKKTLEGETIQVKKQQFLSVLKELITTVNTVYGINKIVFPISNDFFHTDNYQNQTTNGTPQDVLVSYDNEYEEGFDLLVKAIIILSSFSNSLEIILVQGNHDRTKSFYLAHALEVMFKNNKQIKFQREHSTTKCVVLGNTFIGYHHGNCKIDDLPLLFATGKDSKEFGNSVYREIHTGDKHHYMAKEIKGVRIQQSPSLSGTDRWHLDNNFVHSVRAGLATVFDPEKGRIAEFESRI